MKVFVGTEVYEGNIFCVDPVTSSIVLEIEENKAYQLINGSSITKVEGDWSGVVVPNLSKLGISVRNLEKREADASSLAVKHMESLNMKVDSTAQSIFDAFFKIYECRWHDSDIIVLNEFIIKSPYDVVEIRKESKETKESAGFQRIQKMLANERKKLNI